MAAEKKATRAACGETLVELVEQGIDVVAVEADLSGSTTTKKLGAAHPERLVNVGIAEQDMVGVAAGLSLTGHTAFTGSFAVFGTGRVYDQIRNTVCYANLNVKIAPTHAGISVGPDGGSHQMVEDIALMRVLPNMTVFVPSDATECEQCVRAAAEINGPVYIRTARLPSPVYDARPFTVGKGNVIKDGKDCVIFTCGIMLEHCLEAVQLLAEQGIDAALVSFHTLKPFDDELARTYAAKCGKVFTVEEHSIIGGLGDAVASAICGMGLKHFEKIGINDVFGQSGKPAALLEEYGLTGKQIADRIAKA